MMNIYIGNLPFNITEDQLRAHYEAFGEVASARIITDRETGRSRGFGFIEMPDDSAAEAAIEATNGSEMDGRTLSVNQARPREERPRRTGSGGDRF